MSTGAESKTSADAAALRLLARLYQDDLIDSADERAPHDATEASTAARQIDSHAHHAHSDDALSNSSHTGATIDAIQRATARDEIHAFRDDGAATSDEDRGFDVTLQRMRELRSVLSDMRTESTPSDKGMDTLLAAAAAAVAGRSQTVAVNVNPAPNAQHASSDSLPVGASHLPSARAVESVANSNATARSGNAIAASSRTSDGSGTGGAWHRWRASLLRIAARPAFAAAAGLVLVAGAASAIYMRSGTMDAGTADSQARSATSPNSPAPTDSVAIAEATTTPREAENAQENPQTPTESAAPPASAVSAEGVGRTEFGRASGSSEAAAAAGPVAQGTSPRDDNDLADKKASPTRGGNAGSQYGTVDQRVGVASGGLTGGIGATNSSGDRNSVSSDERKPREASKSPNVKAKRSATEPEAQDAAEAALAEESAADNFARPPTKITAGAHQPVASGGSGIGQGSIVSEAPSNAIQAAPTPIPAPTIAPPRAPTAAKPGAAPKPAPAYKTEAASPPPPPDVRATKPAAKQPSKAAETAAPAKNDSSMAGKAAPANAPATAEPTESARDEKPSATNVDTLVAQLRAAASRSDCATVQKLFARVASLDGKRAQAVRAEKSVAVCLTKR